MALILRIDIKGAVIIVVQEVRLTRCCIEIVVSHGGEQRGRSRTDSDTWIEN